MKYWVITDTHFGHEKMHKYCQRPEGFEDIILENLTKLDPDDVLIHLGDFCIGNTLEWTEVFMLNCQCKKWLIKGNHDKKSYSWYLDHGWDFIADGVSLTMYGKKILLSHKPSEGDFDINIHGHHHNTGHHPEDETDGRHKLLFIEHHYKPVLLRTLMEGWFSNMSNGESEDVLSNTHLR